MFTKEQEYDWSDTFVEATSKQEVEVFPSAETISQVGCSWLTHYNTAQYWNSILSYSMSHCSLELL